MSWNNCKQCVFVPRSSFTSALFKVLLTLKLLHGSRTGTKGSTLEDIAMHMIKHFCLDGDIKSQVLASLKYGVKMHFIHKKKDKFSLILPASSIHLAPCKFKNEEMERINCIFPPEWYSNSCNSGNVCGGESEESCCGKRKKRTSSICCEGQDDDEESDNVHSRDSCSEQSSPKKKKQHLCEQCHQKKSKGRVCPKPQPPICSRMKRKKKRCGPPDPLNDLCQYCEPREEEPRQGSSYSYEAHVNCKCCNK